MEDKLCQPTHRQLEGHLREGGGGEREREREERRGKTVVNREEREMERGGNERIT